MLSTNINISHLRCFWMHLMLICLLNTKLNNKKRCSSPSLNKSNLRETLENYVCHAIRSIHPYLLPQQMHPEGGCHVHPLTSGGWTPSYCHVIDLTSEPSAVSHPGQRLQKCLSRSKLITRTWSRISRLNLPFSAAEPPAHNTDQFCSQFTIMSALMAFHVWLGLLTKSVFKGKNKSKKNPSGAVVTPWVAPVKVFSTNHTNGRKFYIHNLSIKFASRKYLQPMVSWIFMCALYWDIALPG